MNAEEESPVPGLRELPRELAPARDLWPGIAPRLRRRRHPQPWIGLALAASVVVALAVQLRWPSAGAPDPALPESAAASFTLVAAMPTHQRALVKANLKIADDAASQLQRALRRQPESESLQRLLVATRRQQHELRRLLDAPPESPSAV